MALVTIQRSPTPSLPLEESLSDVGNCSSEASIVTTERQTPQGSSWEVGEVSSVLWQVSPNFSTYSYESTSTSYVPSAFTAANGTRRRIYAVVPN
ncbi:hypothetical protein M513_13721 [Trichuris suis]|uniref:Uncharacterized protein n=1 Tax=Trichuris suis TaxID=68888 RepID=A0A085LKA5_9BILA|nr:hypothetical protein M513_13721 [Trichuris suis]